jgi:citrate lyase subunit beta / citryl-CoA lyase
MISSYKSILYVPANKPAMMEKSRGLPCCAVIFDLEDAVTPDEKTAARDSLASYLETPFAKPYFIRINPPGTEHFQKDVALLTKVKPHGIVLPKASADGVVVTSKALHCLGEKLKTIGIIPLIETALAVETLFPIIDASPRVMAAQLGAEDLTADLGIQRTPTGREIDYARHRVVYGCRAKGLPAWDTPFLDLKDSESLLTDCHRARDIGFAGKTCIHPSQLETVNQSFTPSASEIAEAEAIIEAAADSKESVFLLNNRMIDAPVLHRANQILARR